MLRKEHHTNPSGAARSPLQTLDGPKQTTAQITGNTLDTQVHPMNAQRPLTPIAFACLLVFATIGAHANDDQSVTTESLAYTGTNAVEPLLLGPLLPADAECDEPGMLGVRFCHALQPWNHGDDNATYPDRVTIHVRDDLGPRVGFHYEFRNTTSGDVLSSGRACGLVHAPVPHIGPMGIAGSQNATELLVVPDTIVNTGLRPDDIGGSARPEVCGSPGTTGLVTVNWRYG